MPFSRSGEGVRNDRRSEVYFFFIWFDSPVYRETEVADMNILLPLLVCGYCLAADQKGPVLSLPPAGDGYFGKILESDTELQLSPELKIVENTGPVCAYVFKQRDDEVPFVFDVLDKETGKAAVTVKPGLKLDACRRNTYKFKIAAQRCADGAVGAFAAVEITVEDVNDHGPEFERPWYTVTVDEGKVYDRIVQLRATDKDCEKQYADICRFEITNNAVPFEVTESGVLRNRLPLNYTQSHSHIVSVVAHDCGMRESKPTLVTVKVRRQCTPGWTGFEEKVEYRPGSVKSLAEHALLDLCDLDCELEAVNVTMRLKTEHIAMGCDRESLKAQGCDADGETVELLAQSRSEEDDLYLFDGENNAVIVPPETAKPDIPQRFTLTWWMRHDRSSKTDGHTRENILCSSDDHKMNRHHFAVFLRNCKLEILLRQEGGKESAFRPAEWRWRLGEVCDGHWHHYAVSMAFPDIELLVDGKAVSVSEQNPEILDDWPMHVIKDVKTRLVVGACWHGGANKMAQYFKGHLAGMTYLVGKKEKTEVIQCARRCREQLQLTDLDRLKPGMEAIFNNEMNELTVRGKDAEAVSDVLSKVTYVNQRQYPTPGHRGVTVDTSLKCAKMEKLIELSTVQSYVMVDKAADPEVTLSGNGALSHNWDEVSAGVNLFPDLSIKTEGGEQRLDYCKIEVKPAMVKDHEYFSSPAELIASLGLDFQHEDGGLMLKGLEKVKGYQEVLQQLHYFNLRPSLYPKRVFSLQCATMRGRVLSNVLTVSMAVEANPPTTQKPKMEVHVDHEEKAVHKMSLERLRADSPRGPSLAALPFVNQAGYETYSSSTGAGMAVAIVVVVCVAFVLVLVIVGILKLRGGKHGRHRRLPTTDGTELAWDDSGLNITVNPMEGVAKAATTREVSEDEYSDEYSDDGEYNEDAEAGEVSDEDEDETVLPHVTGGPTGLEWDDSATLQKAGPGGGSSTPMTRSQTYRV